MQIKVESIMRKLFSQLDQELQNFLLGDLGFLTLDSEEKQLDFVKRILAMNKVEVKELKIKLKKWHTSKSYKNLLIKFNDEFKEKVVPEVNKAQKAAHEFIEKRESDLAEELINKSLTEIDG